MKNCPVCQKEEWDYDVIAGDKTFCGSCYWYFKHEAKKPLPLNIKWYRKTLVNARKAKAENRIY